MKPYFESANVEEIDLLELGYSFAESGHRDAAEICFLRSTERFERMNAIDRNMISNVTYEEVRRLLRVAGGGNVRDLRAVRLRRIVRNRLEEVVSHLKFNRQPCDSCVLGAVYKELGRCKRAIVAFDDCNAKACETSTNMDPLRLDAHRAHCLERLGCHEAALKVMSRTLLTHIARQRNDRGRFRTDAFMRTAAQRLLLLQRRSGRMNEAERLFATLQKFPQIPWTRVSQFPVHVPTTARLSGT